MLQRLSREYVKNSGFPSYSVQYNDYILFYSPTDSIKLARSGKFAFKTDRTCEYF